MDALSKVLETIKFKGVVYDKRELSAPWGIEIQKDEASQFWRLLKGKCWLKVPGEPPIEMQEGELIFVPHGSAHWIADHPRSNRVSSTTFRAARAGGNPMFTGDGDTTVLLGGHFEFDTKPVHPFLADLPQLIRITDFKNGKCAPGCNRPPTSSPKKSVTTGPAAGLFSVRLAEIAFVYLIRAYLEKADNAKGFLLALKDERISTALKLMQEFPEKEWTPPHPRLRRRCMSRSLFCQAFKKTVGETPLSYLTNWRIIKAKELLLANKGNISDIAIDVGYRSEAAFNRIFKKKTSQTPAGFRRTPRPHPAPPPPHPQ